MTIDEASRFMASELASAVALEASCRRPKDQMLSIHTVYMGAQSSGVW